MKTIRATTYLCLFVLFFSSCEDSPIEGVTDQETVPQQESVSVEQAKEYFFNYLDDLQFGDSDNLIRIPIWSRSFTTETDSATILSVPLVYAGESYKSNVSRNLLFFNSNNKQGLKSLIQVLIIDPSELESEEFQRDPTSFKGALIFEDWHDGPLYGYTIVDGKIDATIYNLKKTYDNGRQTQTNGCTPSADIYDCTVTYTWSGSSGWHYNGTVCDWVDVEWTCTPDVPAYMVTALNTTSTYYGSFPSPVFPNGVDLTSVRDCVKGIFESVKNYVHFHAMASTIASQIVQLGGTSDLYEFFETIYDADSPFVLKFVEGNLDPGQNAATATSSQGLGNRRQIVITFDSGYLNTATDLSIARTIIHESLHAFFVLGREGQMGSAFAEAHILLYDGSGQYTLGQQEHNQMAETYVDEISTLLKTFANNQGITPPVPPVERDLYYDLLAYGGLEGTDAWGDLDYATTYAAQIIHNEKQGNTNSSRTSRC